MQTELQQKLIESGEIVRQTEKEYKRARATGDQQAIEKAQWWLEFMRLFYLYFEAMVARESLNLEMEYDEQPDFLSFREPQKLKGH